MFRSLQQQILSSNKAGSCDDEFMQLVFCRFLRTEQNTQVLYTLSTSISPTLCKRKASVLQQRKRFFLMLTAKTT